MSATVLLEYQDQLGARSIQPVTVEPNGTLRFDENGRPISAGADGSSGGGTGVFCFDEDATGWSTPEGNVKARAAAFCYGKINGGLWVKTNEDNDETGWVELIAPAS